MSAARRTTLRATAPAARLAALALAFALVLAGCAATGPAELPPAPSGTPPAPVVVPPPRPAAAGASRDTMPSPAALAVLASIPEPLGASNGGAQPLPATPPVTQAPPPAIAPPPVAADSSAATPAPIDSAANAGAADTAAVPVPAPTSPLGSGSAGAVLPATPEPPASPAPPPVAMPATPPVAAPAPDSCWRVQVGAPIDRAKGRQLRDASESQLLVPMIADHEGGRWKVRTRDCLSRTAAESLRDRAVGSGFKGVFLVRVAGPKPVSKPVPSR